MRASTSRAIGDIFRETSIGFCAWFLVRATFFAAFIWTGRENYSLVSDVEIHSKLLRPGIDMFAAWAFVIFVLAWRLRRLGLSQFARSTFLASLLWIATLCSILLFLPALIAAGDIPFSSRLPFVGFRAEVFYFLVLLGLLVAAYWRLRSPGQADDRQ
ncbi:MAG: hypothetical protein U0002_04690 [Thermoanaerobaculia bacterium]